MSYCADAYFIGGWGVNKVCGRSEGTAPPRRPHADGAVHGQGALRPDQRASGLMGAPTKPSSGAGAGGAGVTLSLRRGRAQAGKAGLGHMGKVQHRQHVAVPNRPARGLARPTGAHGPRKRPIELQRNYTEFTENQRLQRPVRAKKAPK